MQLCMWLQLLASWDEYRFLHCMIGVCEFSHSGASLLLPSLQHWLYLTSSIGTMITIMEFNFSLLLNLLQRHFCTHGFGHQVDANSRHHSHWPLWGSSVLSLQRRNCAMEASQCSELWWKGMLIKCTWLNCPYHDWISDWSDPPNCMEKVMLQPRVYVSWYWNHPAVWRWCSHLPVRMQW